MSAVEKNRYRSISIPENLCKAIEAVIRDFPERGYSSIADFIKEACRLRIDQLRKWKLLKAGSSTIDVDSDVEIFEEGSQC